MLPHNPVATGVVDGNVMKNARMLWRRLFPWQPAMTKENSRRVWKTKQCRHCFDVMLAVDQIGRRRNRIEVIDHGNSRFAKFLCCWSKLRAVDNWRVPATKQARRQLTDVKLRTGSSAQEVVRD